MLLFLKIKLIGETDIETILNVLESFRNLSENHFNF